MRERWNLDRLADLEVYTVTRNSFGEEIKTWSTLKPEVWIGLKTTDTGGDEEIQGKQLVSDKRVTIKTRFMTGLSPTAKMRWLCEGYYYNILYFNEIQRREGYTFICESRDNTDGKIV